MTTKAELEAELAALKNQLNQRDSKPAPPSQRAEPAEQTASETTDIPLAGISDFLKTHGLGVEDLESLWAQVNSELDGLPNKKPLLTAVGAFGLGFVLGRISKKQSGRQG